VEYEKTGKVERSRKMRNKVNILKRKMRVIARYATVAVILAILAFGVNCIPVTTAFGTGSGLLIEKIIEHRDFFIRLDGYDGDLLCDVNGELGEGNIGLLLLDPSGLLKSLVFEPCRYPTPG
jgi:hypothetical protein